MLESSISVASVMMHIDQPKVIPGHLYLRQQHTVEIIQLVEGPPPPRQIPSVINSSTSYSSSDYASEPSSSSDDESESICSSYCSSDLPLQQLDSDKSRAQHSADQPDLETSTIRMKRILAWREDFSSTMGTTCSDTSPLKRKFLCSDDSDARSYSPKIQQPDLSLLDAHSCPACDSLFPSPQRLRQHGCDANANEACCAAVEYAFE